MQGLLLIDHGSRLAAANQRLERLTKLVRTELVRNAIATDCYITHAHMELAAPSIADAIGKCAGMGVKDLRVVPYFLSPGRHVTEDIPRLVAEAVALHPDLNATIAEAVGLHCAMPRLIIEQASFLAAAEFDDTL